MAKQRPIVTPATTPVRRGPDGDIHFLPSSTPPDPTRRLMWPTHAKDLSPRPRLYRIDRVDAFAWQAYVTDEGQELPIGKPDLFDILKAKVAGCMRAEGQRDYLASKAKKETDAQKEALAAAEQQKAQAPDA